MKEVLSGLGALVKLIGEFKALAAWIDDKFGEKPEDVIIQVAEVFRSVRTAKTKEEKFGAARKVSKLLRKF
jgi:hypothetical protein